MTVPQRGDESTQDDGGTKEQLRLQARKTGTADGRSGLMGSMTAQHPSGWPLVKKRKVWRSNFGPDAESGPFGHFVT